MSMLAEPRRKIKWTINPRGKLWSDDTNRYGQRMLKKMGWREGRGLGAKEQGRTSHVAIKLKNDNRGVGFERKDRDWCKHQAKFDDVLANLNETIGSTGETAMPKSLEESSRQSNARLHYAKFTRGKDLTRYSKKDLDCILGIQDASKETESIGTSSSDDVTSVDSSFGIKTIVGGSIQDYLRKKSNTSSSSVIVLDETSEEGICPGKAQFKKRKGAASDDGSVKFKTKKPKKGKQASSSEERLSSAEVPLIELEQREISKSMSLEVDERDEHANAICINLVTSDSNPSEVVNSADDENSDPLPCEVEVKLTPTRKRKRKRTVSTEPGSSSSDDIPLAENSICKHEIKETSPLAKREKSRKRRKSIRIGQENYNTDVIEVAHTATGDSREEILLAKKKKLRKIKSTTDISSSQSSPSEDDSITILKNPKEEGSIIMMMKGKQGNCILTQDPERTGKAFEQIELEGKKGKRLLTKSKLKRKAINVRSDINNGELEKTNSNDDDNWKLVTDKKIEEKSVNNNKKTIVVDLTNTTVMEDALSGENNSASCVNREAGSASMQKKGDKEFLFVELSSSDNSPMEDTGDSSEKIVIESEHEFVIKKSKKRRKNKGHGNASESSLVEEGVNNKLSDPLRKTMKESFGVFIEKVKKRSKEVTCQGPSDRKVEEVNVSDSCEGSESSMKSSTSVVTIDLTGPENQVIEETDENEVIKESDKSEVIEEKDEECFYKCYKRREMPDVLPSSVIHMFVGSNIGDIKGY